MVESGGSRWWLMVVEGVFGSLGEIFSCTDLFLREEENVKDAGDVVVTPVNSSLALSGGNILVAPSSTSPTLRSHDELQNIGATTVVHEPLEDASMEVQVE
ncbi:hypothetical protein Tco_0687091 [Tanacetum coccineum]